MDYSFSFGISKHMLVYVQGVNTTRLSATDSWYVYDWWATEMMYAFDELFHK